LGWIKLATEVKTFVILRQRQSASSRPTEHHVRFHAVIQIANHVRIACKHTREGARQNLFLEGT
jgi:hypothetical protein